jgi:hypothetical protein
MKKTIHSVCFSLETCWGYILCICQEARISVRQMDTKVDDLGASFVLVRKVEVCAAVLGRVSAGILSVEGGRQQGVLEAPWPRAQIDGITGSGCTVLGSFG